MTSPEQVFTPDPNRTMWDVLTNRYPLEGTTIPNRPLKSPEHIGAGKKMYERTELFWNRTRTARGAFESDDNSIKIQGTKKETLSLEIHDAPNPIPGEGGSATISLKREWLTSRFVLEVLATPEESVDPLDEVKTNITKYTFGMNGGLSKTSYTITSGQLVNDPDIQEQIEDPANCVFGTRDITLVAIAFQALDDALTAVKL